jgi:holo-[acyl-carrier protein] synthase
MEIIGSGIGAREISRIAAAIERYGDRFVRRVVTDEKVADCRRKRDSASSFAARFAAKEAAMKALGNSQHLAIAQVLIVKDTTGG